MQEVTQANQVLIVTPQRTRPRSRSGRPGYDWLSIIRELDARPAWSVCLVRIPADLPKRGAYYGCQTAARAIGLQLHAFKMGRLLLLVKPEEVE